LLLSSSAFGPAVTSGKLVVDSDIEQVFGLGDTELAVCAVGTFCCGRG
jgi:hypothetical protein